MATLAVTPSVVNDLMDDREERELWIVGRLFERPPYFIEGKGGDLRLAKALRVVQEDRCTPNSDGSYTVEGSAGRTYRVTDTCSCPQSQKGKSKYCYHFVAVCLYIEWRKRCASLTAPALPLGPATVDERLAAPHAQEDRMTEDPAEYAYIPEPEPAVAVLEAPEPLRVTIPAEYVMSIKGKRHVLYAGLVIGAQRAGLVSLAADWTYNDAELSLAHAVATFADGRRYEDSGDASPSNVTKGIASHFRRVALTRAKARCLRDALGISECTVEELDVDEAKDGKRPVPDLTAPPPAILKQQIWQLVKQADSTITTREACERYVQRATGLALTPDNYAGILVALEEQPHDTR